MAKQRKRHGEEQETRIIDLDAYREGGAEVGYEEDEEAAGKEREKKMRVPAAVYRVILILLVLVIGVAVWLNWDRLNPARVGDWIRLQLTGAGEGDGFPVSITGSQVMNGNFTSRDGSALVLSDTSFVMLDGSGKETLSLRHNLNRPAMCCAGNRVLLYNEAGMEYRLLSGTETSVEETADREILSGAVAQNGRFALAVRGSDGASDLMVYQPDGSLQFTYLFAQEYITAIALNYDGTYGMVCTVSTDRGELVSRVTVFYFNEAEPIGSFTAPGNLLFDAYWSEGGELYALGESGLLRAASGSYRFSEYDYGGRKPTAYRTEQNRVFLSLSAYEHAGPCTLLVFRGQGDPLEVESPERIQDLSVYGGTVAALAGGAVSSYDFSSGTLLAQYAGAGDAKGIALLNEKTVYALGISEIRLLELE